LLAKFKKRLKNRLLRRNCNYDYATFHVDELSIFQFSGWIYGSASEKLSDSIVAFTLNDTKVCETEASISREDLSESGIGDCGFSVEPNWQVFEEGENAVVMYFNDVPVHVFNIYVTRKQLLVAMTRQVHRQIDLAKTEIINAMNNK